MPTARFAELAEVAVDRHSLFTLEDARSVGYADKSISEMARRGRVERMSQGVYRIPFLPYGELGSYMAAALWPVGVGGVIGHASALDLWDVSDVNPAKIHITVPRLHRVQRAVPTGYVIHREDLDSSDVTDIEGVPVVRLPKAIREAFVDRVALDLLEQAVRHGRERGLLSEATAAGLRAELGLDRIAVDRA